MNNTYMKPEASLDAPTLARIEAAVDSLVALLPGRPLAGKLVTREVLDVPQLIGTLRGRFAACRIEVCPWLPATVKDKDGNEVELLGVMLGESIDPMVIPRMFFLTGEIVKAVPR